MSGPSESELRTLGAAYRTHLERDVLPFWLSGPYDATRGGVFTCLENESGRRVSDDKFVWSQGRFAWLMAHAARLADRGVLHGDSDAYLDAAVTTSRFLLDHAFLENRSCAYLLTADGTKKAFRSGEGHDISFFADCFVTLGLAETARATRDAALLDRAVTLYDDVRDRLSRGSVRMEPYPLPAGYRSHSVPMIMLNVSQELERACRDLGDRRHERLALDGMADMDAILGTFVRADRTVQEVVATDGPERLLTRHRTPGHAIESMWFVIEQALRHDRPEAVAVAIDVMKASIRIGWDEAHGGLLRFVGPDGGAPEGPAAGPFERLILDTWDSKIWWPHSEALYATLLGSIVANDEELLELHDRFYRYVMTTFPNPDRAVGEWIQIRDRAGRPLDKVVGLPVKDPYHVIRNLMLLVELCDGGIEARAAGA